MKDYVPRPGVFILRYDARTGHRSVLVAYGPWPNRQLAYMRLALAGAWDIQGPVERREWDYSPKGRWGVDGPNTAHEIAFLMSGDDPELWWPRVEPPEAFRQMSVWFRGRPSEPALAMMRRFAQDGHGASSRMGGIDPSTVTMESILRGGVRRQNPSGSRRPLVDRLFAFLHRHQLDTYVGDIYEPSPGRRYYSISFGRPATLDGEIQVYGPNFIRIAYARGRDQSRGEVFGSEEDALAWLEAKFVRYDDEVADAVPRKAVKR